MATISSVRICNMAMSHIGVRSSIESLDEATAEAKQCKLWYDWSRLQVLEASDWPFARKRKVLSEHSEDPPEYDWAYRYAYPDGCVKFRLIENPAGPDADPVPFAIEASGDGSVRTILTDQYQATGVFTFDLTDPSLFSPVFIDALAWLIAHRSAFSLTGDKKIAADALNVYGATIRAAEAINSQDGVGRLPRDGDSVRARV